MSLFYLKNYNNLFKNNYSICNIIIVIIHFIQNNKLFIINIFLLPIIISSGFNKYY